MLSDNHSHSTSLNFQHTLSVFENTIITRYLYITVPLLTNTYRAITNYHSHYHTNEHYV